jgi:hypothetical protein
MPSAENNHLFLAACEPTAENKLFSADGTWRSVNFFMAVRDYRK